MKGFIETIKNIFSIEELRKKLIYTFLLIFIYRIGTYIVLPGVDPNALGDLAKSGGSGLLGLLDMFVGGSFNRASIFSLGIMPYISASIAVQLLTMAVPYFQKLQKEGESGRRKINQLTRYLTIGVTILQSVGYITYLRYTAGPAIVIDPFLFSISTVIVLTAGTIFCMWLGERITDKGIGNGISFIIAVGIVARFPFAIAAEFNAKTASGGGGLIFFLLEILFFLAIVVFCIVLTQAVRRIQVQYAKRVVGNRQTSGSRSFIPIKLNTAGVMPIIFAQAILFIPSFVAQFMPESEMMQNIQNNGYVGTFWYEAIYFIIVLAFTYIYTAIMINPTQMADDLKRNGGFIQGVKPGAETAEYIDGVVSRLTLPGGICKLKKPK